MVRKDPMVVTESTSEAKTERKILLHHYSSLSLPLAVGVNDDEADDHFPLPDPADQIQDTCWTALFAGVFLLL